MAPGGVEPPHADSKSAALSAELRGLQRVPLQGVADGIRTRDHRDHNPGLYQLSYRHRAIPFPPKASLRSSQVPLCADRVRGDHGSGPTCSRNRSPR